MRMLLALAFIARWALISYQPQTGVAQASDGVIEVVVRDSATRAPLRGARVTFRGSTSAIDVNTDQTGRAVFKNLSPGTWYIIPDHPGYIPPGAATLRVIAANAKTHQVELFLTRGSIVSGRVTANGIPVVQAFVTLVSTTYVQGKKTVDVSFPYRESQTDDRGEYRLIGLRPGDYYVRVTMPSYLPAPWDNNFWESFPRVVYHPGVLESKNAIFINVRPGQDLPAIDIRLPDVRTFKVSGTVSNQVPGGWVDERGRTHRRVASYYLGPADPESLERIVFTNPASLKDGPGPEETTFEIKGVAPGSYYLYAQFERISGSSDSRFNVRTAVQVGDRDVEGLLITLKAIGSIRGRVRVEGNTPFPASLTRIELQQKDRTWGFLSGSGSAPVDRATGEFIVPSVPEGRFNVMLRWGAEDAYISDIRQAGRSVLDEGVVADGLDQPVEITINPKGATIRGVVQRAESNSEVPAGVTLVPARSRRNNPLLYKRAETDASGRFSLRGVAPGDYSIFAWSALPPGQAEENSQFLTPFELRGTSVSVSPGGTINVQLSAIPLP
jgi:hypothetical protein